MVSSLLVQLSANVPGKAAEDGPSARALAPTWETRRKLLILTLDWPPLVAAVIWGLNQQMEDFSASFLCVTAFQLKSLFGAGMEARLEILEEVSTRGQ